MKCCNHICDQGRDCPNRESFTFDRTVGLIVDFLACVGLFATIAVLGIVAGYNT